MPARKREEQGDYFLQNEIARASDLSPEDRDRLSAAMLACQEASLEVWQFTSWPLRAQAALRPAYELYLLLLDLGDPAIDDLASQPFFQQGRARKLSRKKPALFALQLALRPRHEKQRKLCSSWVPLIEIFAKKRVAPADFEAELRRTNLRACTEESREERRRGRAAVAEDSSSTSVTGPEQTHLDVGEAVRGPAEGEAHQAWNDPADTGCVAEDEDWRAVGKAELILEIAVTVGPYKLITSKRPIPKECSEAIQDIIDQRLLRPLNASTLEQIGKLLRDLPPGNPRRDGSGRDAFQSARKVRTS